MSNVIEFYCSKCRKYLHTDYHVTGDDTALVLPNQSVNCVSKHCKRVLYLKNYTERMVIDDIEDGKFYM